MNDFLKTQFTVALSCISFRHQDPHSSQLTIKIQKLETNIVRSAYQSHQIKTRQGLPTLDDNDKVKKMKKGLDSIASLKSRRDLLVSGCIRDFSHSESAMFIHDSVYQIVMDYHCRIRSMEESISIYLCGSISSRLSICKHEDEENESANSDTKVIVDRGLCSDALRQGVWRVEDPDGGGSVLRFVKYSDGHEIGNPLYLSSGLNTNPLICFLVILRAIP